MARQEDVNRIIQELDAATNEIASDLERLRGEVAAGTVSADSVTALDGMVARLKALGADPENPVPPVAPTL